MSINIVHPLGLEPPVDKIRNGHLSSVDYQEWLHKTKADAKAAKYHNLQGHYADLGGFRRSLLEADAERVLRFMGYQPWLEKSDPPPVGRYCRYEGVQIKLIANQGKSREKPVWYKPDLWLWENGTCRIWEPKGALTPKSKLVLRLMAEQRPELPVDLITEAELNARAMAAICEAKSRGVNVSSGIPHWHEGPTQKPTT